MFIPTEGQGIDIARRIIRRKSGQGILMGRPISEDGGSFNVLEVDLQCLAQHLNLELEVELQLREVVQFREQAQNCHEPRVRKLENR